jgi:hypothetical protein
MNLLHTFAELNKLYESKDTYWIFKGKATFKDLYNNEKTISVFPPVQVHGSTEARALSNVKWLLRKKHGLNINTPIILSDYLIAKLTPDKSYKICPKCEKTRLTDGGYCPVCDDGTEDLEEGIFDNKFSNKSSWVSASGQPISLAPKQASQVISGQGLMEEKYIVRIVSHNGRLRALATDGIHPAAWVAFPNSLRQFEGQMYEVDQLVWNGKNYRVIGNINPVKSVATTQNINENINKESFKMNFQTVLEELDKIYEELPAEEAAEKAVEESTEEAEVAEESTKEALTEEAEEEVVVDDEPIVDDEAASEEAQLVLECAKCGALVIKADADVAIDEESGLANSEEACQYCEETAGYKVLGNFIPAEAPVEESLEEGIFDKRQEKTIKATEVKPGDKIIATGPFGKTNQPDRVKKVSTRNDGSVDIIYNGGNMTIGPDDTVTVLTKN